MLGGEGTVLWYPAERLRRAQAANKRLTYAGEMTDLPILWIMRLLEWVTNAGMTGSKDSVPCSLH